MKILFLDQSGKPGGAELSLLDLAKNYRDRCMIGLFADGTYRELLEQNHIPVQVLCDRPIRASKTGQLWENLSSITQLLPLVKRVVSLSRSYDLIYANTQKAFVVGAIASFITRRPLVYHLRDILSPEHFSSFNRRLAITLANQCASLVIANSQATAEAFINAGGRAELVKVVYNGFEPELYRVAASDRDQLRQQIGGDQQFVVGHFSRLSPWKGQHILIEALVHCPEHVVALLVGDALFGEQEYVQQLHQQVKRLGLEHRVKFLGFRQDVIPLMAACDAIAHTSIAPEPFGRVIVEAMLCNKPVVASAAGGALELIEHGLTGWLIPPNDPLKLAEAIQYLYTYPQITENIANQAQCHASQKFNLAVTSQQIERLINTIGQSPQQLSLKTES